MNAFSIAKKLNIRLDKYHETISLSDFNNLKEIVEFCSSKTNDLADVKVSLSDYDESYFILYIPKTEQELLKEIEEIKKSYQDCVDIDYNHTYFDIRYTNIQILFNILFLYCKINNLGLSWMPLLNDNKDVLLNKGIKLGLFFRNNITIKTKNLFKKIKNILEESELL